MLFNSFEFAVFLAAVLCVYAPLRLRGQNISLLIASYTFYGFWDWRFLTLIAFSTTVDYLIAQRIFALGSSSLGGSANIPSSSIEDKRKRLLYLSLISNLGLLGIFKYFNFFVDTFVAMGLHVGLNLDTPALRLLPPVGISFYTFQSMAYSIDVYRRQLKPERNFIIFALFISYFPQLVAGPIERASRLLPQFRKQRVVTLDCVRSGLVLILIGLFKKVVIADNAGAAVNSIFSDIGSKGSVTLLAGGVLFTLQIYGDFSGYSNMARGMSRLLGVRLVENFKTPYLSANISEFWRRWHISLSEWLRDYLYIPLGGSRNGKLQTYRNLLLTMLLGGLWHGAAWTFVLWGFLNGAYLMVHRWWQRSSRIRVWLVEKSQTGTRAEGQTDQSGIVSTGSLAARLRWLLAAGLTYTCVMFAFVIFRADSISDAYAFFQGVADVRGGIPLWDLMLIGVLLALLAPVELIQYTHGGRLLAIRDLNLPLRSTLYALMVVALLLASSTDIPFIYFQF